MGDLSYNLSRDEFACQCGAPACDRVPVDIGLVHTLQGAVNHFQLAERARRDDFVRVAIHITSGYRCPAHNAAVEGAPRSTHLVGMGADHWLENVYADGSREVIPADLVADYYEIKYPLTHGVVRYNNFTHVDTRPVAYRGDRRS